MKKLAILALGAAMTTAAAPAQKISSDGAQQTFRFYVDQYFDDVFSFAPTYGTQAGFHQYDGRLEDYSAAAVQTQIKSMREWQKKLEAVPADGLDGSVADDRQVLLNNIESTLLSLETIRMWEKNPDNYSSGITNSIFVLMSRDFAPVDTRLRAAVEREKLMPQVFLEARKNLKNPPKIYTEIAIEQIPGIVSFFENDVPLAFSKATNAETKTDFAKSNKAVIDALKSYGDWLKSDLLPRSNGDFRFGETTFRKKLALDEMVDLPLDKLVEIDMANMRANQAEFARIAKELDPTKTPEQVLAELGNIHPAPDKLLNAFQDTFNSLISFIRAKKIITIPSDVQPTLEETPPFMRATTFASMDSPGAYEKNSTKAYFNVTLPEKDWTAAHVAEHMASFNIGTIISTAVHEAYPGHYVQFLWQSQFPSKVRKLTMSASNVEGWAHYTEQMMLDEGYGQPGAGAKDDREAKLIRLGQLQDALLRNARFIVGLKMHTGQMTFDEGVDFFVKEGYQSRASATVETKRGTADALYMYYTLGKLEILKLREDVKKKQGAAFSLEKFHDDLMRQGPVPIKIIRKSMLHDNSPVL
ncbi:MAG: DUF885 domain-containing protein [Acidobacteriaceae bacterium]|nr:DUF885 domain-containing protein [Acidobacteriaceae bacterium]